MKMKVFPKLINFSVLTVVYLLDLSVCLQQNFGSTLTKDEILQRHCAFAKGLHPNLIRFVTKEGYHRELEDTVEITFTSSQLSPSDFTAGHCKLALLAKFGRDLYLDPYELQDQGQGSWVRVLNNWTDLEGPAWAARSNSTALLELKVSATGNLITSEVSRLPVHFRYQRPLPHSRFKERLRQSQQEASGALVNPAGYSKVMIPLPRLLLRCDKWEEEAEKGLLVEAKCHVVKTYCGMKGGEVCGWITLPFKSNSKQGNPVFVPVGDADQVWLVSGLTLLVVLGGAMFLLQTLLRTKEKLLAEQEEEDRAKAD